MEIHTIGFTRKSAREFFEILKAASIRRVVDVRRKNTSQLAGFAKKDDLAYLLEAILGADYLHLPELAPAEELLEAWKKKSIDWEAYEAAYLADLASRNVAETLDRAVFSVPVALLCSEPEPDFCHRRLAAEHLASRWKNVSIRHL